MTIQKNIHFIHAADAPQHSGKLQEILDQLKSENRIGNYLVYGATDDLSSLQAKIGPDDMVISMLTHEMEPQKADIEDTLHKLKDRRIKVAEVVVDHVTYEKEFITFPADLKPIREREDMDATWGNIAQQLREIFPGQADDPPPPPPPPPIEWAKYLKYAAMVAIIAIAGWAVWKFVLSKGPVANFTFGIFDVDSGSFKETNECFAPCIVVFTDQSEDAKQLEWSFGDDSTSIGKTPSHLFATASTYNITLTAINGKKTNSADKKLLVKPRPAADFEATGNGCFAPCQVSFENRSIASSKYTWDFGDTTDLSTVVTPLHNYENAGEYTVKLISENDEGLQASVEKPITVRNEPYPLAQFNFKTKYKSKRPPASRPAAFAANKVATYSIVYNLLPATVTFENISEDAESYEWDFGDGLRITSKNQVKSPSHAYTSHGIYKVKLTAKDGPKSHTITKDVIIKETNQGWNRNQLRVLQNINVQKAAKEMLTQ